MCFIGFEYLEGTHISKSGQVHPNLPNVMHVVTKVHVIVWRCVVLTWIRDNKETM